MTNHVKAGGPANQLIALYREARANGVPADELFETIVAAGEVWGSAYKAEAKEAARLGEADARILRNEGHICPRYPRSALRLIDELSLTLSRLHLKHPGELTAKESETLVRARRVVFDEKE